MPVLEHLVRLAQHGLILKQPEAVILMAIQACSTQPNRQFARDLRNSNFRDQALALGTDFLADATCCIHSLGLGLRLPNQENEYGVGSVSCAAVMEASNLLDQLQEVDASALKLISIESIEAIDLKARF